MGVTSTIQWTDGTWNLARGCSKVNDDCLFCYMMRDGERYKYDGKVVIRTKTVFNLPNRIDDGKKIFMSSLTDVFHEDIDSFREEAYQIMRNNPGKIYQVLTKRWERVADHLPHDWGEGWANVWLGASAGNQKNYDEMVSHLKKVRAKIRWASLEPLRGPISLGLLDKNLGAFQWIVVGGESGNETGKYRYRPCEMEWIVDIISQCRAAGVKVFVKQTGTYLAKKLKLKTRHGVEFSEWPSELQIREFPIHELITNSIT